MKKFLFAVLCAFPLFAGNAFAFKATPFKGAYQIVSQSAPAALDRQLMSIDVDTLEVMWAKYASGPFPTNLEDIKNEGTILVHFGNRDTSFFTLEANCMISANYMSIHDDDKDMEIRTRPDGNYDLAVTEKNVTAFYVLHKL
jgi:hypothetical protein